MKQNINPLMRLRQPKCGLAQRISKNKYLINTVGEGFGLVRSLLPTFIATLTNTVVPTTGIGSYTFSRGGSVSTVIDFDGVTKQNLADEIRFKGARRVENVVDDANPFTWSNVITTSTFARTTNGTLQNGATIYRFTMYVTGDSTFSAYDQYNVSASAEATNEYVSSFWVKCSKEVVLTIANPDAASNTSDITIAANTLTRISSNVTTNLVGILSRIGLFQNTTTAFLDGDWIEIAGIQYEEVTNQTKQVASEFVSVGLSEEFGTNVDGVKYFSTENGNSVSGNILTEATGSNITAATLKGVLIEEGRTNLALGDDDLTGGAETITLSATGDYTLSVYGTAAVTVAATTATGTGFAQATEGNPVEFNITATGDITLTLDTGSLDTLNGSAMKQVELGIVQSSFIPTTSASGVRDADIGPDYDKSNLSDDMTLAIDIEIEATATGVNLKGQKIINATNVAETKYIRLGFNFQGSLQFYVFDGTNFYAESSGIISAGTHKLAFRTGLNAGESAIYLDGSRVDATPAVDVNRSSIISDITTFRVGAQQTVEFLQGNCKNLRIWNTRLTDAELVAMTT